MGLSVGTAIRAVQVFLVDAALTLLGFCSAGIGIWRLYLGDPTLDATGLGAGLILLFAATIHRFESLKGWGMEAKTKQLSEKIDQAETLIRRLNTVTELTAVNLVKIASGMGRFDTGFSTREAYELSRKFITIMKENGSDEEKIRAGLLPWARIAALDFVRAKHKPIFDEVQGKQHELMRLPVNSGPDTLVRNQHVSDALAYLNRRNELSDWPATGKALLWQELIDAIPDTCADARDRYKESLQPFIAEIAYLERHLDFHDKELWFSVEPQ